MKSSKEKIVLTERQKETIKNLKDPVYSVEYVEEWINRDDNVFANAPAALAAMGVRGFYSAVVCMTEDYDNSVKEKEVDLDAAKEFLIKNKVSFENLIRCFNFLEGKSIEERVDI